MKLPETSELVSHSDHQLYRRDLLEFHSADERDFYSQMQKTRIRAIVDSVTRHARPRRVLDLGCAQGNIALLLAEAGFDAWAVDLRVDFLKYAALKHERGTFSRVAANGECLPFPAHFFDVVVWGEMIEHVAYPERVLAEIRRVLADQGLLLITTPNGSRLRTGLPTFSRVSDRIHLEDRQFQPDSDGHLFLFEKLELIELLKSQNFQPIRHRYMCSPWITGRLGFRHWMTWMPAASRRYLDLWTLKVEPMAKRLAEGQLILAQRSGI